MTNTWMGFAVLIFSSVLHAAAAAQVTAPMPGSTAPPTTAAAEVTACSQAQMVVDSLLTGANARLESARQSNDPAEMRAAVDALQTTIRDVRAQLAACANVAAADSHAWHAMPGVSMAPAMGSMPDMKTPEHGAAPETTKPARSGKAPVQPPMDHSKMHMGSPPAAKLSSPAGTKPTAPAAPMDHSKMVMAAPPDALATATDPVCGLKVDPAAAPKAIHQGETYYFCSERHQQLFTKTPAKYLPKRK